MRVIKDREIYQEVVEKGLLQATRFLWIATANIKDMQVKQLGRYHSILGSFAAMSGKGLEIRLIHAGKVSAAFQESFRRFPELARMMETLICPRVHFKMVIVDGVWAYTGSANFTGAGMGIKSENRRNFEIGTLIDDPLGVKELMDYFDRIWMGQHCLRCGHRKICPQPIE